MKQTHVQRPRTAVDPATARMPPRWVPVRALHEGHRAKLRAHLLALNEIDRVWRFGHATSDAHLERYAQQLDFRRDHLFGTFDRRLDLLAVGHLAMDADGDGAELGLSVLARARGLGLGRRLFEHAVTHARNLGLHTLHLQLARDNAPMLAIVQRAGAAIDFDGVEASAALALPANTLVSHLEELLGKRVADFDFRFKRQSLKVDALQTRAPRAS